MEFTEIYFTTVGFIMGLIIIIAFVGKALAYKNLKIGNMVVVGNGYGDTFSGEYLGNTELGEMRIKGTDGIIYNVKSIHIVSVGD